MRKSNCPSCGAELHFHNSASATAICDYCSSTIHLVGDKANNLGKMSDVIKDFSPIQIGTTGKHEDNKLITRNFTVIGLAQVKYDVGHWNEWHILFDDGEFGWLSDSSGQYSILFSEDADNIPPYDDIQVNTSVYINNVNWVATDKRVATLISAKGELPNKTFQGKKYGTIDLRNNNKVATIDYSENKPSFYVGFATDDIASLHLTNTVVEEERGSSSIKAGELKSFECVNCGNPLIYHEQITTHVACPACNSLLQIEQEQQKIVEHLRQSAQNPTLKIGSKGLLKNHNYEIIGFMQKSDGEYRWEEYLLYSQKKGGFLWLSNSDGEWEVIEVLNSFPSKTINGVIYKNKEFIRQNISYAETKYVIGEFNWRVNINDKTIVTSYKNGKYILYEEKDNHEVTWSLAQEISQNTIFTIFGKEISKKDNFSSATTEHKDTLEHKHIIGAIGIVWLLQIFTYFAIHGVGNAVIASIIILLIGYGTNQED